MVKIPEGNDYLVMVRKANFLEHSLDLNIAGLAA
jgi:hypothetical protein